MYLQFQGCFSPLYCGEVNRVDCRSDCLFMQLKFLSTPAIGETLVVKSPLTLYSIDTHFDASTTDSF